MSSKRQRITEELRRRRMARAAALALASHRAPRYDAIFFEAMRAAAEDGEHAET